MALWSNNKYDRETANGAIVRALTPPENFQIVAIKLRLSEVGGVSEDFTVTVASNAGATYNLVLLRQDMEAVRDVYWSPDKDMTFEDGDTIILAYPNSNGRIFGLETIYRQAK